MEQTSLALPPHRPCNNHTGIEPNFTIGVENLPSIISVIGGGLEHCAVAGFLRVGLGGTDFTLDELLSFSRQEVRLEGRKRC